MNKRRKKERKNIYRQKERDIKRNKKACYYFLSFRFSRKNKSDEKKERKFERKKERKR